MPLQVISMCAVYIKGKNILTIWTTVQTYQFPQACVYPASLRPALLTVSHLHSSPFPTNKVGCLDAAGV